MDLFARMPELFPLMRGGGAFLVLIGLGIVAGAFTRQRRTRLVWLIVGAALGVIVMAVGGATKVIFAGLPYPAVWQWIVLGVAFLVEMGLVNVVLRKVPDWNSRPFWLWILFIVGAHFLILGPSHGPVCFLLALACMANALIGLRATSVDLRWFWAVDGVLKVVGGGLMVLLSFSLG
ncbi:hypothetical protein KXS11_00425 [Plantibacter flavus]|uniref:DUF6609 family protein n=1 Tax=Plantibacter flavus TaxID=150123 RepID=UPI003F167808